MGRLGPEMERSVSGRNEEIPISYFKLAGPLTGTLRLATDRSLLLPARGIPLLISVGRWARC